MERNNFTKFLIDVCQSSLSMECHLMDSGYTADQAKEKTIKIMQYNIEEE